MKSKLLMFLCACTLILKSQIPDLVWKRNFGGNNIDVVKCIRPTGDKGYIMAGTTNSTNILGHHGNSDIWIVKVDYAGEKQWEKCLGGSLDESNTDSIDNHLHIENTLDGGFIISTYSKSNDHDLTYNGGLADGWVVKLDNKGNIEWQKSFGGNSDDHLMAVKQLNDSSYVLIGRVWSQNNNYSSFPGNYWYLKLDSKGQKITEKGFRLYPNMNNLYDNLNCINISDDGGFVIGGEFMGDLLLAKMNSNMELQWEWVVAQGKDRVNEIINVKGGGYLSIAQAGYTTDDTTSFFIDNYHGGGDALVTKLRNDGSVEWQKAIGGSAFDAAYSGVETKDGGFIITGTTWSKNGDFPNNKGKGDMFLVKLSAKGDILWQRLIGQNHNEAIHSIIIDSEDDLVFAGISDAKDGDLFASNGKTDSWLFKMHQPKIAYKITGKVFNDENKNNLCDNNEIGLEGIKVFLDNEGTYSCTYTDSLGNYELFAYHTGQAKVEIEFPKHAELSNNGGFQYYMLPVANLNNNITEQNFALYFNPNKHDISVKVVPGPIRPGFNNYCFVIVKNEGYVLENNIECELSFDSILSFVSGDISVNASQGKLNFNLGSLKGRESKKFKFDFVSPPDADLINKKCVYNAFVPLLNDVDTTNNTDSFVVIITGSYDPNCKSSDGTEIVPNSKKINYVIQFQNTGTDTAFVIVVKDKLDTNLFDVRSIQLQASSHHYSFNIDTAGVAAWRFENILLPDSNTNEKESHGFISFSIQLKNLKKGDIIKNGAAIYFDYNLPIYTNIAEDTVVSPLSVKEHLIKDCKIYPNPTNGLISVRMDDFSMIDFIEIRNIQGALLEKTKISGYQAVFNLNQYERGIYLIQIYQNDKVLTAKVICQ